MKTEGWETRLAEFAAARLGRPFSWGADDCCLLAADWAEVAIGVDPAAALRGYADQAGALEALQAYAGGKVLKTVHRIGREIGMVPVDVRRAQRGDVMGFRVPAPFYLSLGVCIGAQSLGIAGDRVVMVPTRTAARAWRL